MNIFMKDKKNVTLHTANKYCKEDINIMFGSEEKLSSNIIPYVNHMTFTNNISEVTEDIYLDLSRATNISSMFFTNTINCEKLTVKVSNLCTNFTNAFWGRYDLNEKLKTIEILGDTSNVTLFDSAFRNRANLESLLGEIDFSSNTRPLTNLFINDNKLKEIYPKAGTIKATIAFTNLIDESIQAVIDGLADLRDTTAQTVTFPKETIARLTNEQKASITSKNWTLA